MTIKHYNPTQQVEPPVFAPLRKNEGTFYSNLTRSVKTAYTYADKINNMYTYSGFVSRLKLSSSTVPNLYAIVGILDDETIETNLIDNELTRYAIVLAIDSDGYCLVCTFNPNLVFPSEYMTFSLSDIGKNLYIDTSLNRLTTIKASSSSIVIGRITGQNSLFFFGTSYFLYDAIAGSQA